MSYKCKCKLAVSHKCISLKIGGFLTIMARKRNDIIPARLKDCSGDLSRQWFVEYSFRNKKTNEMKRYRKFIPAGLDRKGRIAYANKLIDSINNELSDGWSPIAEDIAFASELNYNREATTFKRKKRTKSIVAFTVSEFLLSKKSELKEKSYTTYQSRMRTFVMYLDSIDQLDIKLKDINTKFVVTFLKFLVDRDELSILTIKKYQQILHAYFKYCISEGLVKENPVIDIPKSIGKRVDCAAAGLSSTDRTQLLDIIRRDDPQLYLACSMLFYCAIRPGEELRGLKVKDIDFNSCKIVISADRAKNGQRETISMPKQLRNLLREHRIDLEHYDNYVFSQYGRPGKTMLGKNTLRNRFNAIRDKHGFSTEYKLYSWKHSGAQALKDADASPWTVMRHLRHKNMETTERYLRKRIGTVSDQIIDHFPDID